MSTIIIITPPKKPTATEADAAPMLLSPYAEARAAIDAAEAEGTDVRIIET